MSNSNGPRRPAAASSQFVFAIGGMLVAVLLLGAGAFLWLTGSRAGATVGGPFTLENSSGQVVTDKDYRGKYMLVYFGYTYCPDVCPTTLNAIAGALNKLGPKANDLVPIFITVDPERDTPAVMKRYTAAFSPRLVGLTGTPAEIAKVAREYRVYYAKHVTGPGPNDYSMDHSSVIYLMGPHGKFIAPVSDDGSPAQMAGKIAKLMS